MANKNADHILYEGCSRYLSLRSSMMDAFVMVDMSGRVMESNALFQSMLGYTEAELRVKTYVELTPAKWHALEAKIVEEQVLVRGESEIYEKEYICKDGTVLPIELKTIILCDAHQHAEAMWAIVRDISERKRAEAAMLESESHYRLAMKAISGVVYDWNFRTDKIFFSEGALGLIGESFDDSMSIREWWSRRVHPEDIKKVLSEITDAVKMQANQYQLEYRMRHKNGCWVCVSDRSVIVRNEDGIAVRLVGSVVDISARVNAENALRRLNDSLEEQVTERNAQLEVRVNELRESDRFIRATLDSIHSAVCVIDENGDILFKNKTWLDFDKLNLWKDGDFANRYCPVCNNCQTNTICVADKKINLAVDKALKGESKSFSLEYEVGSPLSSRWYLVRLTRFKGGGPIRLTLSHEDITKRKLAANEISKAAKNFKIMLRKAELDYAGRSKKIAREVHDQLGATLTMLKLGLATTLGSPELAEPVRTRLTEIIELADMALKSVKRVTASLRPSMLDTLGLVAAVNWHAKEFSRMTGMKTDVKSPDEVILSAERSESVFHVVQEALTNAAKHSNANKVSIAIRQKDRRLIVSVSDNGKGLLPESRTRNNSYGLIGMQERASYLNGSLSIGNQPAGGVRLTLNIPLVAPLPASHWGRVIS